MWILKTQEGPVGEPVWCSTASDLRKHFGEQTLNLANKDFASPQTFYLNQTMSYDGAFIVRALPTDATYAAAVLVAEVKAADIVQYMTDDDGNRLIDQDPDSDTYGKYIPVMNATTGKPETAPGIKITFKLLPDTAVQKYLTIDPATGTLIEDNLGSIKVANGVYPILAIRANNPGQYGNELAFRFFYKESENSAPNTRLYETIFNCFSVSRREYNSSTTDCIFDLYGRLYNTFTANPECADPESGIQMGMDSVITNAFDADNSEGSDFPFVVYTYEDNLKAIGEQIIEVESEKSLAISEFGYTSKTEMNGYQVNVLSGTNINGVPYDHVAISGRNDVDPAVVYTYAETSDTTYQENKTYYKSAFVPGTTVVKYFKFDDYNVGDSIVADPDLTVIEPVYVPCTEQYDAYVDQTIYAYQDGAYVTATPSAEEFNSNPSNWYVKISDTTEHTGIYERTVVPDETTDYDKQTTRVILDSAIDMFLTGGSDGSLDSGKPVNCSEFDRDNIVDQYVYRFLKLKINPKIVDKFRYPITHLYDCGFSMTTKYAMIDFLDIRDDVAVELSTQTIFPSDWATGVPTVAKDDYRTKINLNDQAKDIMNGMVLRERALLMRESVLKGTECMRASIYTQAGKPVSANYIKPVPFTLWSAVQHARYGNTDQMSVQEPRGLPYSYNEMFKVWNWTNYSEPMKEKTWNNGLNYCQFADMKRIFYPALRTVYREETSVLVDQWVMDALVYTKHECRKAWARFSGRNDKQAIIESAIKVYLENTLAHLYNGKYSFTVDVYKTEEEQKLGYVEHVKLSLEFPATMRVLVFDIEVNREGYSPESEE
jgi:hypothetical protein